jgi:hypothetical protein
VKNNNNASVRDGLRRMLQWNGDLLKRQHEALSREPQLILEWKYLWGEEHPEPDVDPEEYRRKLAALGAARMYNQVALNLFEKLPKPGPTSKRDVGYQQLKAECIRLHGNTRRAGRLFVKLACERDPDLHPHTAENVWALLRKADRK